jgi:hypothetical protein
MAAGTVLGFQWWSLLGAQASGQKGRDGTDPD